MKALKLASGHSMPLLGLGTWDLRGKECIAVVRKALDLGYRHIDTAYMYENQQAIGRALRESSVDRGEVFITTKIWRDSLRRAQVLEQCDQCLDMLDMECVDLLLIHWPSESVPLEETLEAFNEISRQGKARSIGVSNFSAAQVDQARQLSPAPVCVNQVRCHVGHNQEELRRHCREKGVAITAYCPLARGRAASDEVLHKIGKGRGKSAAQVALRWLVQKEVIAIPKARSEEHLRANLDVFSWELDPEEMAQVERL
jgi:diketogulonate reductase-like aldo/keto reductase